MQAKISELKRLWAEGADLRSAGLVLNWDQSTYMPNGGTPARARQIALLARLAQERTIDPRIGHLLDELTSYAEGLPYDHPDAALVRVGRRFYERALKVPPAFMGEMYQLGAETFSAWAKARPENDFKTLRPYLEKILDNSRRLANFFSGYEHIADPLIDDSDYGMKATTLRQLFKDLRGQLVPLVKNITDQPPADDSCLHRHFNQPGQLAISDQLVRQIGYDFNRGRLDLTHHPFTIRLSDGDIRITTRVKEDDLGDCLFSCLHEAGHALYEQGGRPEFDASPLGFGTSAGVHESQSRLWENLVGRSRDFWVYAYPHLQAAFPGVLDDVSLETFYRAINKVQRSLIRVDADEVTYNLHVMIRFELELRLLEGDLQVRDLPDAWHANYQADLGVRAPDDRDGVMQDVHWFMGQIGGMFQGYTLGNILSAQFFNAALQAHPEISTQMRTGQFDTLHHWLIDNLYQYGSMFTADEIVQRATGKPMSIQPYMTYLREKYGELYTL